MDVTKLRHRVALFGATRTPDSEGGYTETWTALAPPYAYASIEPATPSDLERLVGNTVTAPVSHVISMRYHPEVTTQTRITFNGRTFNVRGKQNLEEKNVELRLACEEVAA